MLSLLSKKEEQDFSRKNACFKLFRISLCKKSLMNSQIKRAFKKAEIYNFAVNI
jgi:hypothetical protein